MVCLLGRRTKPSRNLPGAHRCSRIRLTSRPTTTSSLFWLTERGVGGVTDGWGVRGRYVSLRPFLSSAFFVSFVVCGRGYGLRGGHVGVEDVALPAYRNQATRVLRVWLNLLADALYQLLQGTI